MKMPIHYRVNDLRRIAGQWITGHSYGTVFFEIVGACNAKCRWCTTGRETSETVKPPTIISVGQFETTIATLLARHIISKRATIHLFNWGEPMLHPQINDLLRVLKDYGLHFTLSTNGSRFVALDASVLPYLSFLRFSVSGFSQQSYTRINRLDFQSVLTNLQTFSEDMHAKWPRAKLEMAYLTYTFNIAETRAASEFCHLHGIQFVPSAAFLNDFTLTKAYLQGTMPPDLLKDVKADLILNYVSNLLEDMPAHYRCPQLDLLTIDENCSLLTCCCLPRSHPNYSLDAIANLDKKTIQNKKTSQSICPECMALGVSWWLHHPQMMQPADLVTKG